MSQTVISYTAEYQVTGWQYSGLKDGEAIFFFFYYFKANGTPFVETRGWLNDQFDPTPTSIYTFADTSPDTLPVYYLNLQIKERVSGLTRTTTDLPADATINVKRDLLMLRDNLVASGTYNQTGNQVYAYSGTSVPTSTNGNFGMLGIMQLNTANPPVPVPVPISVVEAASDAVMAESEQINTEIAADVKAEIRLLENKRRQLFAGWDATGNTINLGGPEKKEKDLPGIPVTDWTGSTSYKDQVIDTYGSKYDMLQTGAPVGSLVYANPPSNNQGENPFSLLSDLPRAAFNGFSGAMGTLGNILNFHIGPPGANALTSRKDLVLQKIWKESPTGDLEEVFGKYYDQLDSVDKKVHEFMLHMNPSDPIIQDVIRWNGPSIEFTDTAIDSYNKITGQSLPYYTNTVATIKPWDVFFPSTHLNLNIQHNLHRLKMTIRSDPKFLDRSELLKEIYEANDKDAETTVRYIMDPENQAIRDKVQFDVDLWEGKQKAESKDGFWAFMNHAIIPFVRGDGFRKIKSDSYTGSFANGALALVPSPDSVISKVATGAVLSGLGLGIGGAILLTAIAHGADEYFALHHQHIDPFQNVHGDFNDLMARVGNRDIRQLDFRQPSVMNVVGGENAQAFAEALQHVDDFHQDLVEGVHSYVNNEALKRMNHMLDELTLAGDREAIKAWKDSVGGNAFLNSLGFNERAARIFDKVAVKDGKLNPHAFGEFLFRTDPTLKKVLATGSPKEVFKYLGGWVVDHPKTAALVLSGIGYGASQLGLFDYIYGAPRLARDRRPDIGRYTYLDQRYQQRQNQRALPNMSDNMSALAVPIEEIPRPQRYTYEYVDHTGEFPYYEYYDQPYQYEEPAETTPGTMVQLSGEPVSQPPRGRTVFDRQHLDNWRARTRALNQQRATAQSSSRGSYQTGAYQPTAALAVAPALLPGADGQPYGGAGGLSHHDDVGSRKRDAKAFFKMGGADHMRQEKINMEKHCITVAAQIFDKFIHPQTPGEKREADRVLRGVDNIVNTGHVGYIYTAVPQPAQQYASRAYNKERKHRYLAKHILDEVCKVMRAKHTKTQSRIYDRPLLGKRPGVPFSGQGF